MDNQDEALDGIFSQIFGANAAKEMARIKKAQAVEAQQSKHVKDFLRHLYEHDRSQGKK